MVETDAHPSRRRWPWVVLAFGLLLTILAFLSEVEDTADVAQRVAAPPAPIVSVVAVSKAEARAQISVFAELRPRWDTEIRAAVSGRITAIHEEALAGSRVPKGAALIQIQRTQLATEVAAAELALEEARLALLRAQNQTTVARRQFARDGQTPPNDLALYLPQLRIAERGLNAAEAQLAAARKRLEQADVRAPYSGFVTKRVASLGQTVSVGEPLLHLSDDSEFELVASLSPDEWALLDHPIEGGTAQLFLRDGQAVGVATIRQVGGFLDAETRQMRVYLEVSEPSDRVLSGDFLRVTFEGRVIENTLTLPEAALTRAGHIWFVDEAGMLQRGQPEILFRTQDSLTIAAPDGPGPWNVASAPLASFLPGQLVTPQPVED